LYSSPSIIKGKEGCPYTSKYHTMTWVTVDTAPSSPW